MLVGLPEQYTDYLKCPMIDARRMEVYCLLGYNASTIIKETHALIVDEKSFENNLKNEKTLFFGNGSGKCKSVLTSKNAFFLEGVTPEAKNVGELAVAKLDTKNYADLAYFEPDYLKPYHAIKAKNPLA
jgi:tRNA threonylcarbamoyladenosine biosynthesis protein TsaB